VSNKIKGFTIILNEACSEEYAGHMKQALLMMKNVVGVEVHKQTGGDHLTRMSCEAEARRKMHDFIADFKLTGKVV